MTKLPIALTELFEKALLRDLHGVEGSKDRWQQRRSTGLSDQELKEAISEEFGLGGGFCCYEDADGVNWDTWHQGGVSPYFQLSELTRTDSEEEFEEAFKNKRRFKLSGYELLAAVRRVLAISSPVPEGQIAMEFLHG